MLTVEKFELSGDARAAILFMPEGATILNVAEQYGRLVLWALVDTMRPLMERRIRWEFTGHAIQTAGTLRYITTIQSTQRSQAVLVYHFFEEIQDA